MRPVRLHLEGFGVFRAPTEIDFADAEYFALVGPTGAGKSTVIDAICFALYGSIPRYDDERRVARVVSLGALQAKVSLTFDAGGGRYLATRVVRLGKGKADAVLEREVAGGTEVVASGAREMKSAVEQLLGLPFAHFTKCVVLPQGEFDRFLHDDPSARRDLLTRLLDLGVYDRIGQRAREVAREAAKAGELHRHALEEVAFATPEARATAEQRVETLRDLYRLVEDASTADAADADERGRLQSAVAAAQQLATALDGVQAPKGIDELAAAQHALAVERDEARAALDSATAALASAEGALNEAPTRDALQTAARAHDEAARLDERIATAVEDESQRRDEATRALTVVERAAAHVAEQQATLDAQRDAHAAHALAAHLVVGEPCPVCEHEVASKPKRRRPAALSKAETALADARALHDQALTAQAALAASLAGAEATAVQLRERRGSLESDLASYPDREALTELLHALDELATTLERARTQERAARKRLEAIQRQVDELDATTTRVRAAFATTRDAIVRAGGTPPDATTDVGTDWQTLAMFAAEARADVEATLASLRHDQATLDEAAATRLQTIADAARDAGVRAPVNALTAWRDVVVEAGATARHDVQRIDEALERATKLREALTTAETEHRVAQKLGELLKSDHFEKWVLRAALAALVEHASTTLLALSDGHYSLRHTSEEEFVVVDHHNADETRSVRTLSGGETFQASLALALALSDQIAQLSAASAGARLDALFCDEGFGSLDLDTLDTVASTIETLGTTGRMVGLVTHVPALAERVPVRFRVHDGTVVREDS